MWHTFDLRAELPDRWQEQILEVAGMSSQAKSLTPTSVTSRESEDVQDLPVLTVGGQSVKDELPWLYELYRGRFRDLAQEIVSEKVAIAEDVRRSINLNVQRGTEMRYESHVDSNPIEGLLYASDHPPGSGGELVVSNLGDPHGIGAINADATRIYPLAGYLVFFDARVHSHYVAQLRDPEAVRVVAAMNFYTESCPESMRPSDLDAHLFGRS